MQKQAHYSFVRRLLFPYSGKEVLTRAQGTRVIITWAAFFALIYLIGTLPIVVILQVTSLQKFVLMLLIAFFIGAVIFGLFAWFVVIMNNQSARVSQKLKAQNAAKTSSNSGGRDGS